MPSPFPGMDPYLESPDIWPDFHERFATQISSELNQRLPAPFYARLEMRPEVGIVEEGTALRRIVPDVAVAQAPGAAAVGVAVMDAPRTTISKSLKTLIPIAPLRHHFIEIRDPTRGHRLITLIEIVSPSNKRSGPDRRSYELKQQEVLESDANLIEVDLLRDGQRLFANEALRAFVGRIEPAPDYVVLVNRYWQRVSDEMGYEVFPVPITEPLPCIPIPLREEHEELPLDLQHVFKKVYDDGPYRRGAVDYGQPPRPPLTADTLAWLQKLLATRAPDARRT